MLRQLNYVLDNFKLTLFSCKGLSGMNTSIGEAGEVVDSHEMQLSQNQLTIPAIGRLPSLQITLAPGVDLTKPDTWPTKSHWTEADYLPGEGIFDPTRPDEAQLIRIYLLSPTKNQTRISATVEGLAELIFDTAVEGKIKRDLEVTINEDGGLLIAGGHRRYRAALAAGLKFVSVKLASKGPRGLSERSNHLRAMIMDNRLSEQLTISNEVQNAKDYLTERQDDICSGTGQNNSSLTEQELIGILVTELRMTAEKARQMLDLMNLHPSIFDLVARGNLTIKEAATLAKKVPDQDLQYTLVRDFLSRKGEATFQSIVGQKTPSKPKAPTKQKTVLLTSDRFTEKIDGLDAPVVVDIRSEAYLNDRQKLYVLKKVMARLGIEV